MKNFSENNIENLIPKYCEGTLSESESQLVEDWIKASPDNYRIVKDIHKILFALETVQSQNEIDIEAAFTSINGKINPIRKISLLMWMQRVAAILFIPVFIALLLQYMKKEVSKEQLIEIRTNPGMLTRLTLPDGSKIVLNSDTYFSYPADFTKDVRAVTLNGEAWFNVEKDPQRKFIVNVPHQSAIEVLGTSFNLEAYSLDSTVTTYLQEGKVKFIYDQNNQNKSYNLQPGEKLVYNSLSSKVKLYKTKGLTETSWKDEKIILANTSFNETIRLLEKRYNVAFRILNNKYMNDSFTGTFTNQRLDLILEVFKRSSGIKWRYVEPENTFDEKRIIEIY